MPAPTRPTNYAKPFAASGTRNTIPDAPTGTNHASFSEGFPAITMLPISSGGVPPAGNDFNGIFYDMMTHTVWVNAGGQYQFDSALSTAMGGYPQGMVLQSNDGLSSYVSLVNSNTTDFNSTPASIGTLWGSYSGAAYSNAAITVTGGASTLSAIQALADMITFSGTLTSNATVTFPATAKEYTIVNNTVGAFTLTCIASGGTGVPIRQGGADAIMCDGVNIAYLQQSAVTRTAKDASLALSNTYYADRAAGRVGGFSADNGAVNAISIVTVPSTTTYADGQTVRFRAAFTNTGACTLNAGGGVKTLLKGDGGAIRPGDILSTAVSTATYVLALDKFVLNGLIVPDATIGIWQYINSTQTLSRGSYTPDTTGGGFGCNLNSTPSVGDAVVVYDAFGSFAVNNCTIAATGGILLKVKTTGVTGSSYVMNVIGTMTMFAYDGTYWEIS